MGREWKAWKPAPRANRMYRARRARRAGVPAAPGSDRARRGRPRSHVWQGRVGARDTRRSGGSREPRARIPRAKRGRARRPPRPDVAKRGKNGRGHRSARSLGAGSIPRAFAARHPGSRRRDPGDVRASARARIARTDRALRIVRAPPCGLRRTRLPHLARPPHPSQPPRRPLADGPARALWHARAAPRRGGTADPRRAAVTARRRDPLRPARPGTGAHRRPLFFGAGTDTLGSRPDRHEPARRSSPGCSCGKATRIATAPSSRPRSRSLGRETATQT